MMRRLTLAALLAAALHAAAMDCPDPPKQTQKDWDTQIKVEVGRIGPVRGAELQINDLVFFSILDVVQCYNFLKSENQVIFF